MMERSCSIAKAKKKKTKTFDGCWSCRERGVKCDEGKPECDNCLKNAIKCKGYDIRLSWDTRKTDNLRRFKIYDHFQHRYFANCNLKESIDDIDELVEKHNCRAIVKTPFTVFETNDLVQYWFENVVCRFQLKWFTAMVRQNLNNKVVIFSIYSSSLYFKGNDEHLKKSKFYFDYVWREEFEQHSIFDEFDALNWILSLINLLLTSDLVGECQINCFEALDKITRLMPKISPLPEYNLLNQLIVFLKSLKFIPPEITGESMIDLTDLGIKNQLLQSWYSILSIESNRDLPFFELENQLWFKKKSLILPSNDPRHDKSYIWYIAMYIYFIKKFYHEHHGLISIDYLVNEVTPHLTNLNDEQDILGLKWCLIIIRNESRLMECNHILSKCFFDIPETDDENWISYIKSSSILIL